VLSPEIGDRDEVEAGNWAITKKSHSYKILVEKINSLEMKDVKTVFLSSTHSYLSLQTFLTLCLK
jgi:hypothetical protein